MMPKPRTVRKLPVGSEGREINILFSPKTFSELFLRIIMPRGNNTSDYTRIPVM